jgi:hypothetical protein
MTMLRSWWYGCAMSVIASCAVTAVAAPPTSFRITQIFSSQDGSTQYVVLTEMAGLAGPDDFQDVMLTATHGSVTKSITLPRALPTEHTTHRSFVVGFANEQVASASGPVDVIYGYNCCTAQAAHVDLAMPARFLPTDGGTLKLGNVDTWTYEQLPTDGRTALHRDAPAGPGTLPTASCPGNPPFCPDTMHPVAYLPTAVEYYNAARDHYFVTASAPDIDALDTGRLPGWERTGEAFSVGAIATTRLGLEYTYAGSPVCRFYLPPSAGDTHFFSGSAAECNFVAERYPDFVLETTAAFYAAPVVATATGECGVIVGFIDGDIPLRPVYRLWNQRQQTNHRYTTSPAIRAAMIAQGWVPEGTGPLGVAWCVI